MRHQQYLMGAMAALALACLAGGAAYAENATSTGWDGSAAVIGSADAQSIQKAFDVVNAQAADDNQAAKLIEVRDERGRGGRGGGPRYGYHGGRRFWLGNQWCYYITPSWDDCSVDAGNLGYPFWKIWGGWCMGCE